MEELIGSLLALLLLIMVIAGAGTLVSSCLDAQVSHARCGYYSGCVERTNNVDIKLHE